MKYFYLLSILFVTSCSLFSEKEEGLIAKVGEEYLYESELDNFTFENEEDSIEKVRSYVESWVREQLLVQKALDNLGDDQANFEKQLKNYKKSLLIYAFENQLIKQKLDTVISNEEFETYYSANEINFKLKEDIINCNFVHYYNSAPHQDSLNSKLYKEEDLAWLSNYCTQFAIGCHLENDVWIPFTKIKNLGDYTSDNNLYLSLGKNEISDSTKTLLINIFEIKKEGEIAPLSYVKEQVRDIILNKRKIQLISKVKQEIFEDATLKNKYEIFEK